MMDTPIKRFGITLLIVGLVIFFIGLWIVAFDSSDIRYFWRSFKQYWERPFHGRAYNFLHYGTALAVAGSFLSIFYDATTGRLINWIKHG